MTEAEAMKPKKKNVQLTRATADRLIAELMVRAGQFDNPYVSIGRLAVFGSYLKPETPRLGDLDIAVEILRKPAWDVNKISNLAGAPGWVRGWARMYLQRLYWPDEAVYRAVKGGSKAISVHTWQELEDQRWAHQVIREAPAGAAHGECCPCSRCWSEREKQSAAAAEQPPQDKP